MKNIVVSEYNVDKDVSDNCKDLISKLLGHDTVNRINVNDIFNHPWIKSFELPQNTSDNEKLSELSIAIENNISIAGVKKEMSIIKEEQTESNIDLTQGTNKNLFDKVINKIEKKQKRNQSQEFMTQSIAELNDTIEKVGKAAKNKITLKVDRVKTIEDERLSSIVPKHEINYSMIKEIREIDKQIDINSNKILSMQKDSNKYLETIESKSKIKSSKLLFNMQNTEEFYKTNNSNDNQTLILSSPNNDNNIKETKKQLTLSINNANSLCILPIKESKRNITDIKIKKTKTSSVSSTIFPKAKEIVVKDEDYLGDRIRRRDVTKMMKMRYAGNELSMMEDNIFRSNLSAVVEETKETEKKSAWNNLVNMFKCAS